MKQAFNLAHKTQINRDDKDVVRDLIHTNATFASAATGAGDALRFAAEKSPFDSTTVMYEPTRFGLPVWHGGVSIHKKGHPPNLKRMPERHGQRRLPGRRGQR